ncbi:hypothetical protein BSKO_00543 [Bryopsis sp. KO-2023]|nr:hypothetical protein BSKO_00543 [Bryopsis sp. KO-2023]
MPGSSELFLRHGVGGNFPRCSRPGMRMRQGVFARRCSSNRLVGVSSSMSFKHALKGNPLSSGCNGQSRSRFRTRLAPPVQAAMFDNLTKSLNNAWDMVKKDGKLTPDNVKGPMREIRRALLEADVSLPVVRRFVKSVEQNALGIKVIRGVTPEIQLVKTVSDQLVALMGNKRADLVEVEEEESPQIIMMAGLQGVGKTTACGKMALYLKNIESKVVMIAADVYRPAAIDQLAKVGSQIDVDVFRMDNTVDPVEIVRKGVEYAKEQGADSVIVDTAGRLQIDEDMMTELKNMKSAVSPTDILLVVDAMTGQEAAGLVKSFNEALELTGAVLTKMDGDSRGGAALSVFEVSGKPIKFVGTGEKMEALEPFYPERMSSRILGMGDMLTLYEKADSAIKEDEAKELTKKMMEAKFDLDDFIKQYEMISNMGSMGAVMKLMPGMSGVSDKDIYEAEKRFKRFKALISSMTPDERSNPDLLAKSPSRRRRIIRGSGTTESDMDNLIGTFTSMRSTMQDMTRMMALRNQGQEIPGMPTMSNEELLSSMVNSSVSNVPPGMVRRKKDKRIRKQELKERSLAN